MRKTFRNCLAALLALIMLLSCAAASAGTVYTKVNVNREVVAQLLPAFGVPEEQMATMDPIFALISALGIKVTTVEDGAQIDLDLNGTEALSLGIAMGEEGMTAVSTLFPNYAVTMKQETLAKLMESFTANLPGGGAGGLAGFDMTGLQAAAEKYITPFADAVSKAFVPGEPVTGEYEFEGYKFDIMFPIAVDVPAVAEALRTMTDGLLGDEEVISAIQGMMQSFGQNFDPEEIKKGIQDFIEHFPDTVNAETYSNSETGAPTYITGEALYEGKENPSYAYTMLTKDSQSWIMTFSDNEQGITVTLSFEENAIRIELKQGEMFAAIVIGFSAGDPATYGVDLYFSSEVPLLSIGVIVSSDGERTLPVEIGEKTVMMLEDALSGNSEATSGLLSDIMSKGLGKLMLTLTKEVPEASSLLTMLMNPGASTGAPAEEAPAAEEPAEETK